MKNIKLKRIGEGWYETSDGLNIQNPHKMDSNDTDRQWYITGVTSDEVGGPFDTLKECRRFLAKREARGEALKVLADEVSGCHGSSERRAVAGWVLDAMDGNDDGLSAIDLCLAISEAAAALAIRLGDDPTEDPRMKAAVEQLAEMAEKNEDVQFAVDDLVYDHIGTSKRGSNINNRGIEGQAEALVEAIGLEETVEALREVIKDLAPRCQ